MTASHLEFLVEEESMEAFAAHIDPERNRSPSFGAFYAVLGEGDLVVPAMHRSDNIQLWRNA